MILLTVDCRPLFLGSQLVWTGGGGFRYTGGFMKENEERAAARALFESEPDRVRTAREIVRALGLRGKQVARLHLALRAMVRDGVIAPTRGGGSYTLAKRMGLVTGPLKTVRSGAGNVTDRETGKTVWIGQEDLGTALPGDIVTVRLFQKEGEARGTVIKIVERSARDVVGTLHATPKFFYVVPLNPVYKKDFYVHSANGAKEGDRVVLRFTGWESSHLAPEGEIVDVIGPADRPSLDTETVMRQFELPGEFPPDAVAEAEKVSRRLSRPGRREDFRKAFVLTIDPATARDFDDAVSLGRDERGNRVLGVHIADVTHFVRPKSALDREARERGTSVYLVDKVIPMLPEQLSNGVCSLRPDEDRLAFSAFLTFDSRGKMIARRFAKTRIRSKLRLNYEQAMSILKGRKPKGLDACPPEAERTVREIGKLAAQLRKRRFAQAALDLDVPEVEIVLDEEARLKEVVTRPYDESHQLIEECMVAANEAVASELWSNGVKILARLHEPPDEEKLQELQAGLALLGFRPGDLSVPANMAKFLKETRDHPLRFHAHSLVLRSMKRAVYSGAKIGHYGLAKTFYAHFTSPIRRYPDLTLHRQLTAYLDGKGARIPQAELDRLAAWTTEREQVADDASRQLVEIKKFRFLQQQLVDRRPVPYPAVVTKCTNFGVFIDIPALAMGGLIHISKLSNQFVRFNPAAETLSAGKRIFRVGTPVTVVIAAVDFDRRFADFALTREETE